MSKNYSHSCSSCTNANNYLGKYIIVDHMNYSDRICQNPFLFINESAQRCNPSEKSIFAQFNKILPECKYFAPKMDLAKTTMKVKQYS